MIHRVASVYNGEWLISILAFRCVFACEVEWMRRADSNVPVDCVLVQSKQDISDSVLLALSQG
jgi:hypothetical protein